MTVLCEEANQGGGLGGKETVAKIPSLHKTPSKVKDNFSSHPSEEPTKACSNLIISNQGEKYKIKLLYEEKRKGKYRADLSNNEDDIDSNEGEENDKEEEGGGETKPNFKSEGRSNHKLYIKEGNEGQGKDIENKKERSQVKSVEQQRIWPKQEKELWLK